MPILPRITRPESVSRTMRSAVRSCGSGRMRAPIVAAPAENVRKRPVRAMSLAIRQRIVDLLRRGIACLHLAEDAECDQTAIGRRVGDVAGAEERRRGEASSHRDEIVGGLRQHVAPGQAIAAASGGAEQTVLPRRIEVAVVPGDVFVDHRARRGMRGDIVDAGLRRRPRPCARHATHFAISAPVRMVRSSCSCHCR